MNFFKRLISDNFSYTMCGNPSSKIENAHLSFIVSNYKLFSLMHRSINHPNYYEFAAIANSLTNLVKSVTVTDYRYNRNTINAEVTFGFGSAVEKSIINSNKFIYYATGSSARFQCIEAENELERIISFFGKESRNFFRIPEYYSGLNEVVADKIYLIGNKFTKNTFALNLHSKIRLLPGISLIQSDTPFYDETDSHLLWIGSKSVLHRGLHIAAEISKLTKKILYVIGVNDFEKDFAHKLLTRSGCKFKLFGYLNVGSNLWFEIIKNCKYVLGCSVSEGMQTGILTAASFGLYPVSTDTCGINYGSIIEFSQRETLPERMAAKIFELEELRFEKMLALKKEIKSSILDNNSPIAFEKVLNSYIAQDIR